jgi:DNA invertase Pin-like site-specific DNA recombinase
VEGDSAERQRAAIRSHAKRAGVEVVAEYYDAATSGSDPVEERAGFKAMLDFLDGDGVRLVLVEDISRFARTVAAQELGLTLMLRRGVQVVAANGDVLTDTDDEARVMIRHVLGAFAQMERTRLVKKLRGARDRASAAAGRRIEGRKPVLVGDALALARNLRRRNPHTGERRSLRAISALLADAGHATPKTGKPFSAEVIRLALARASTASVVGTGPRRVTDTRPTMR